MSIQIDFACNHWRNGMFAGHCSSIHIGSIIIGGLTLEPTRGDLKMDVTHNHILRLGKWHSWPIRGGMVEWIGNWCWNGVHLDPWNAADVLNFAIRKGYRPSCGPMDIWDRIELDSKLEPKDVLELQGA